MGSCSVRKRLAESHKAGLLQVDVALNLVDRWQGQDHGEAQHFLRPN